MPAPSMTIDQYLRMPETVLPQELVWGVVRDAPAPTPGHQWVAARFFLALRAHLEHTPVARVWMSPIDVVLDRHAHLVVQPDLVVIAESRMGIVTDRIWGAPDLVIEILSPSPRIGALTERVEWFALYGVRECWLVDQPTRQIEVLQFGSRAIAQRQSVAPEEPIRSGVLPGFHASPDSIFEL